MTRVDRDAFDYIAISIMVLAVISGVGKHFYDQQIDSGSPAIEDLVALISPVSAGTAGMQTGIHDEIVHQLSDSTPSYIDQELLAPLEKFAWNPVGSETAVAMVDGEPSRIMARARASSVRQPLKDNVTKKAVPDISPGAALARTQELERVADIPAPRDALIIAPVANALYTVQLAAFRSKLRAEQAWGILQNRFLGILNGLDHRIQMVDLGPKRGIIYRLRVGYFYTRNAGMTVCERLISKKQECIVVGRQAQHMAGH